MSADGIDSFYEECSQKLKANSMQHANNECIVWTGCVNKQGYGQFRFRDPRDPNSSVFKTRTSHRVALMLHFRDFDVPSSMQASHLCNNKLCVNVEHLVFEGNSTNNLRKTCFSLHKCIGHFNVDRKRLPDCLVHLDA